MNSADPSHKISKDYGVLIEEEGIALRGLFIIDPKGILRCVSFPLSLLFRFFSSPKTVRSKFILVSLENWTGSSLFLFLFIL